MWDPEHLKLRLFVPNENGIGFKANSFSGNERNRMFLRHAGNYDEVSLISGADFREDGRGFVTFDFDQDGWLDLGVASSNQPRFRVLRNQMKDATVTGSVNSQFKISKSDSAHSACVRLIGGQGSATPTEKWSARDAYGAKLLVTIGNTKRAIQLSCGEGLSSQNSQWLHIGMGGAAQIDQIKITWPSGKTTIHGNIAAGSRTTISEKQQQ